MKISKKNEKIIFLMSSERSGSNLITKIMNSHNLISGPNTKHLFNTILRNIFRYGDINHEINWKKVVQDSVNLVNSEFSFWKSKFSTEEVLAKVKKGNIAELLIYFYRIEAKKTKKNNIFIKENHLYEIYPMLKLLYPDAYYLYLVRDPRDMALSWRENNNHPGGIINAAIQWKKDQQRFLFLESVIDNDKILRVTYEKIITNFKSEIKKITNFLGLEYDPHMQYFYRDESSIENSKKTGAWKNLSKSLIKNNSLKYKKKLSNKEVLFIESIATNEMKHLKYKTENSIKDLSNIKTNQINKYKVDEDNMYPQIIDPNVKLNINIKHNIYNR